MSQSVLDKQAIAPEKAQQPEQYTQQQLETYTRPELWEVCRQNNLKCFPKIADCVEAILSLQSAKIADAEVKEIEAIAVDYYNYLVVLGDRTLAHITHDPEDFATQAWVVEINGEEAHRATTVAQCENWVKWHYKKGTLPIHDEWLTAKEDDFEIHVEKLTAIAKRCCEAQIAPVELPVTEVKVARELHPGDKVVLDGEIWRIERINVQKVQYQVWHSEVHGSRFHLTLLPNDYQYQPFQGEPNDWEGARQHEFAESDRFVDTAKYLCPCGEAEFDVVMKAVLPQPDMTPMTTTGYNFCLANGIQFKQKTGQSGTIYWYGVAPHYYGQPGRQYRTTGFPELKNAIKAAIDYLVKCNVQGAAELKQHLIEERRQAIAPTIPEEQSVAQSELLEYIEEQSEAIAPEPSRFAAAVKQLAHVAFGLVLAAGIGGSAIAAQPHKKVIQPQRNPDALFSFALDYQPPNHGGPEGDRGTGTR